jgi:hypothetical protein
MGEVPHSDASDSGDEQIIETVRWLAFWRAWLAGWAKARGDNLSDPPNLIQLAWEDFQDVDVEYWDVDALRSEHDRFKAALQTIRGPEDRGPWIEVYREAGGGYEGLQAIARVALEGRD